MHRTLYVQNLLESTWRTDAPDSLFGYVQQFENRLGAPMWIRGEGCGDGGGATVITEISTCIGQTRA